MKQKIVNNVRVFLASILAVKFDLSFRLVCILTLKYSHSVYRIESWNIIETDISPRQFRFQTQPARIVLHFPKETRDTRF